VLLNSNTAFLLLEIELKTKKPDRNDQVSCQERDLNLSADRQARTSAGKPE
jgi:hypothetical protein